MRVFVARLFIVRLPRQRPGWAPLDLRDDGRGVGVLQLDPGAAAGIEDEGQAARAGAPMTAEVRFPNHRDLAVRVALDHLILAGLRLTAQGLRKSFM